MAKVTLAFSVDDDKDADIVQWWEGLERRQHSATMRAAIRAYRNTTGLTLGDLLNEIGEIKRLIRAGVVVQTNGNGGDVAQDDEPLDPLAAEAQAALNALAGLG